MKVVVMSNIKGGSGKSTTAVHVSEALARRGKTLVIDLDMQADVTDFFLPGVSLEELEKKNILLLLTGQKSIGDLIFHGKSVDIIPATLTLSRLQKLTEESYFFLNQLRKGLEQVSSTYEYVVIDTPGSSRLELNIALTVANLVTIPVTPSKWAIRAVNLLLDELAATETLFSGKKDAAFIPVLFGTSQKHRDLLERLKSIEEIKTLPEIPRSESIKTKTERHQFLKKDSNPWHSFDHLADAILLILDPPMSYPLG